MRSMRPSGPGRTPARGRARRPSLTAQPNRRGEGIAASSSPRTSRSVSGRRKVSAIRFLARSTKCM